MRPDGFEQFRRAPYEDHDAAEQQPDAGHDHGNP